MAFPDTEVEVSISLVDDEEIADLNRTYKGRTGPTNVLSFSMREGDNLDLHPWFWGEIVVSVDTAYREAQEADISLNSRVIQLIIHGLLHLNGYNHENGATIEEILKMEKRFYELLNLIGEDVP